MPVVATAATQLLILFLINWLIIYVFGKLWVEPTVKAMLYKSVSRHWRIKAGFHMIAMIAAIAGKKRSAIVAIVCKPHFSDRSDHWQHFTRISEERFPYDHNDCWTFFPAIVAIIWKPALRSLTLFILDYGVTQPFFFTKRNWTMHEKLQCYKTSEHKRMKRKKTNNPHFCLAGKLDPCPVLCHSKDD